MEAGYHNRKPVAGSPYRYFDSLETLARWADFLVVAALGGPESRHLVDATILKALGPTGFLVNIGRGSLVDTGALIAALRDGTIAGAGLDVIEGEPHLPEALRASIMSSSRRNGGAVAGIDRRHVPACHRQPPSPFRRRDADVGRARRSRQLAGPDSQIFQRSTIFQSISMPNPGLSVSVSLPASSSGRSVRDGARPDRAPAAESLRRNSHAAWRRRDGRAPADRGGARSAAHAPAHRRRCAGPR